MRSLDTTIFFSSRLLQLAQDFIAKRLGPLFVSAHIRAEKIRIKSRVSFDSNTSVKTCISNLATLVQKYKNVSKVPIPLFLATDFGDYGSKGARITQKKANSLMKVLAPLKPITFQPSAYNLTDHGAVAIVEMNIVW